MRVGFYQFQPRFGEQAQNLQAIDRALAGCQADLVVLPELATTGYNFTSREEALAMAEPVPAGPTVERLQALAAREQTALVAGLAERADVAGTTRLYNSAVLVPPHGPVGLYRKVHLFDREKLIFDEGDLGFPVFTLPGAVPRRVGVMICFDWRFPESARSLALGGAELLAHPANLVKPWCQQAMVTRCLENQVFAVTANRIGEEDRGGHRIAFTGGSQILDTQGRLLASAPAEGESLEVVDIDPAAARNKRTNDRNDLFADRRPEQYRLR